MRTHADARRLGRAVDTHEFHRDILRGSRRIARPMMAIATKQNMGPCRHALAQMVVAGVMTVTPPLRPGQAPPAPASSGPRVLTFTPPPLPDEEPPRPPRSAPSPVARPGAAPAGPGAAARPAAPASAGPARPASPGSAAPARHASPGSAPPARPASGPTVTYERKVIEDFNPFPTEDDE
jgi:hypothetical protein